MENYFLNLNLFFKKIKTVSNLCCLLTLLLIQSVFFQDLGEGGLVAFHY